MSQCKLVVYNHHNIMKLKVSPQRQAKYATQNRLLIQDVGHGSAKKGAITPLSVLAWVFFCSVLKSRVLKLITIHRTF